MAARRAFYTSHPSGTDGIARLHIVRDPSDWRAPQAGQSHLASGMLIGLCGAAPVHYRRSAARPVVIDPMPGTAPPGLRWCPPCLGQLADRAGLSDVLAAILAAVAAPS